MPLTADALTIPAQLRGYVAVALNQGFLTLDGSYFKPNTPLTRIELAIAINRIIQ